MGTTLTGTTPQDTYDSLIKVTDNGPLSGTAKYLSDGLGNDSALALSTGNVGVGTTTITTISGTNPVLTIGGTAISGGLVLQRSGTDKARLYESGDLFIHQGMSSVGHSFYVNASTEAMRITSAGNVGIGTSSPNSKLEVAAGTTIYPINITSSSDIATTTGISMGSFSGLAGGSNGSVYIASAHNHGASAQSSMVFYTHTGSSLTEKVRILAGGGLTFNGDTAAANALDDYEEGTWTMGVSFGNASVGVTYSANTGTYTKIGRQVTVNGYVALSNKGSSTGAARITGLPFTIPNSGSNYSVPSLLLETITFSNQYTGLGQVAFTNIELYEFTVLGVGGPITDADFANNSGIYLSFTYFV